MSSIPWFLSLKPASDDFATTRDTLSPSPSASPSTSRATSPVSKRDNAGLSDSPPLSKAPLSSQTKLSFGEQFRLITSRTRGLVLDAGTDRLDSLLGFMGLGEGDIETGDENFEEQNKEFDGWDEDDDETPLMSPRSWTLTPPSSRSSSASPEPELERVSNISPSLDLIRPLAPLPKRFSSSLLSRRQRSRAPSPSPPPLPTSSSNNDGPNRSYPSPLFHRSGAPAFFCRCAEANNGFYPCSCIVDALMDGRLGSSGDLKMEMRRRKRSRDEVWVLRNVEQEGDVEEDEEESARKRLKPTIKVEEKESGIDELVKMAKAIFEISDISGSVDKELASRLQKIILQSKNTKPNLNSGLVDEKNFLEWRDSQSLGLADLVQEVFRNLDLTPSSVDTYSGPLFHPRLSLNEKVADAAMGNIEVGPWADPGVAQSLRQYYSHQYRWLTEYREMGPTRGIALSEISPTPSGLALQPDFGMDGSETFEPYQEGEDSVRSIGREENFTVGSKGLEVDVNVEMNGFDGDEDGIGGRIYQW